MKTSSKPPSRRYRRVPGSALPSIDAVPVRRGLPTGSRFRRAGLTEGVFYASERPETAVAEIVFYRLLFFAESPHTPWPANPAEYTAFAAEYATKKAIDLTKGKYGAGIARWTHPTDYSHCQALAEAARAAKIEVIRYPSARDPERGVNLALLTCRAFTRPNPLDQRTWHIRLSETGAQAICEAPKFGITFDRDVLLPTRASRSCAGSELKSWHTEDSANLLRSGAVADNQPCSGRAQLRFT